MGVEGRGGYWKDLRNEFNDTELSFGTSGRRVDGGERGEECQGLYGESVKRLIVG